MEIINNDSQPRKLYRSRNKKIGGVCQGLADYFGIDVVIVRIIALLSIFFFSGGLWAYLILWIVVPLEPAGNTDNRNSGGNQQWQQ